MFLQYSNVMLMEMSRFLLKISVFYQKYMSLGVLNEFLLL